MTTSRQELQTYFDRVFPGAKIDTQNSLVGKIHIQFELGGEKFTLYRNGVEFEWWKDKRKMTKEEKSKEEEHYQKRVILAAGRAITIFNETFSNPEAELWLIIYEYNEGLFNDSNDYLLRQFPMENVRNFYDETELVNTGIIITDENGIDTFDKISARIRTGKVRVKNIGVENILKAKANNELGYEPNIAQAVYFLDPTTDRGFYMYDDRGCYVWSNTADKIKDIYIKRPGWALSKDWPF